VSDPDGDTGDSTPVPFLAALVIIVLVLITIGVLTLTRGDGLKEEDRVARAAVAQNDALQRLNYPDYRAYTCAAVAGAESDFTARQRVSAAKQGARVVDGVTGVSIAGDQATGTVVYHFENAPDIKMDARTAFTREDGSWRVCSPGPS
jgi:hypothetical protein